MTGNSKFSNDELAFRKELDRRMILLRERFPNQVSYGTWGGIAETIKSILPKLKGLQNVESKLKDYRLKEHDKQIRKEFIKDEIMFLKSVWTISINMNIFEKIRKRLDKQQKKLQELKKKSK